MNWNHYPKGTEAGDMPLPNGESFGLFKLNAAKTFIENIGGSFLKAFRSSGGDPEVFVDMEWPDESHIEMTDVEIHLGVRGNWTLAPIDQGEKGKKMQKNRVDLYMPLEEIPGFIVAMRYAYERGRAVERFRKATAK